MSDRDRWNQGRDERSRWGQSRGGEQRTGSAGSGRDYGDFSRDHSNGDSDYRSDRTGGSSEYDDNGESRGDRWRQEGDLAASDYRSSEEGDYRSGWSGRRDSYGERSGSRGMQGSEEGRSARSGAMQGGSGQMGMETPSGPHKGRGPKGYTRSDERIEEDLADRLTDAPDIDASGIEVAVSSGEVTLTGFVPDRSAKRRAEDLAEAVSGVKHVQNNLRVKGSEETAMTGSQVGQTSQSAKSRSGGTAMKSTGR
ncbi:MAG: BON domain-containing protein [Bauldia sp.]